MTDDAFIRRVAPAIQRQRIQEGIVMRGRVRVASFRPGHAQFRRQCRAIVQLTIEESETTGRRAARRPLTATRFAPDLGQQMATDRRPAAGSASTIFQQTRKARAVLIHFSRIQQGSNHTAAPDCFMCDTL